MRNLVIGLDGGGSKTVACLAGHDGPAVVPLGRGVSGPSNLLTVADSTALGHVEQAIDAAFRDARLPRTQVHSLCAAMAGSDRELVRQRIRQWAQQTRVARTVQVVHDAEPLLADVDRATDAVALIAGTGSLAYGRAADGRTVRAGGWGPLLGDEGSAYWMGLEGLRWVSRVVDGQSERSDLLDRLKSSVSWEHPLDLPQQVAGMSRESIAALAELVDQSASDGDQQARSICVAAARHLASLVVSVVSRLELSPNSFALVVTGGVLLNRSMVFQLLSDQFLAAGVVPESICCCDDPAWGAVRIACSLPT